MKKSKFDVVIIGGGPAGMAAAIEIKKNGLKPVIIERESRLGGILKQCIHSGFGTHYFGEELTGTEYAYNFVKMTREAGVDVLLESFVISVSANLVVVKNKQGIINIECKAVVLAMGCRERTGGAIGLTGERPSGVWTAGQVQKWINIYGVVPCKKPVILGSGDIGLIMARRLTLEGSKPSMVLEIQKTTAGLKRNIVQCLDDYNIPLYLETTVVEVVGYPTIKGVYIAKVDENKKPIENTKKFISCDGLVLSVGLIPDRELVSGAEINKLTNSFVVNEFRETSIKNIFACGNVLHVHDLVDFVTEESILVGQNVSKSILGQLTRGKKYNVLPGDGIRYTVPNSYFSSSGGEVKFLFRVTREFKDSKLVVRQGDNVIYERPFGNCNAGQMEYVTISKKLLKGDIVISMED